MVSSDASGIAEILEHGRHALLFKNKNPVELYIRIREALYDLEKMRKLADQAYNHVSSKYSYELMMSGYDEIFKKLLK
ncbi:MAG: glycosyltransferase [Candidatus Omnitrophica bacterium]|nr:glycosyltransferase [Candidatus Omnitrophota bacterium]